MYSLLQLKKMEFIELKKDESYTYDIVSCYFWGSDDNSLETFLFLYKNHHLSLSEGSTHQRDKSNIQFIILVKKEKNERENFFLTLQTHFPILFRKCPALQVTCVLISAHILSSLKQILLSKMTQNYEWMCNAINNKIFDYLSV